MHNAYIELLFSVGMLAATIFTGFFILFFIRSIKYRKITPSYVLPIMLLLLARFTTSSSLAFFTKDLILFMCIVIILESSIKMYTYRAK